MAKHYEVCLFFFNPNIFPDQERQHRAAEVVWLAEQLGCSSLVGRDNQALFNTAIAGFENEPERSERCRACYTFRLEETAKLCVLRDIPSFGTSLTLSPLKRVEWILTAGESIAGQYGLHFYPEPFRKKDGYARSIVLSQRFGLYRQDYCGCHYSFLERANRIYKCRHSERGILPTNALYDATGMINRCRV